MTLHVFLSAVRYALHAALSALLVCFAVVVFAFGMQRYHLPSILFFFFFSSIVVVFAAACCTPPSTAVSWTAVMGLPLAVSQTPSQQQSFFFVHREVSRNCAGIRTPAFLYDRTFLLHFLFVPYFQISDFNRPGFSFPPG